MFVKVTPRKKGNKTYYYAELVESYREDGKVKHRRIAYFGRVDPETARRLKIAFSPDFDSFTNLNKVKYLSAVPYGNFFLIEYCLKQLGMFDYFQYNFVSPDPHITVSTALKGIKAMLFQRLLQPDSKLALLEWLPLTPLKHFLAPGELDLQSLYRSLEVLQANLKHVEEYLYHMAIEQFKEDSKELYYDLTSSYFEGRKCIIAEYGYSRDKRKDRKQIVIGLVTTASGFPLKCKVYPGNRVDKTTVKEMISELQEEFPFQEIVLVGDRGMLTADNVATIEELGHKYVMALPRIQSKKYLKDRDINLKSMRKITTDLYAQFIPGGENQRLLLCLNTQKREEDREYRQFCLQSIQEQLERLNNSLGKNKTITSRDEAMKRVGMILKENFARKYFRVVTVNSSKNPLGFEIQYQLKTAQIEEDEKLDGTFMICSNEQSYEDEKLIQVYKNLSQVERAFKVIKNELDIRPINHYKPVRVEGHVYLCVLAYFITKVIEYIAHQKKLNKSAPKILRELSQIALIEIHLPDGQKKYSLTTMQEEHKEIFKAFQIKNVEIPDVG